MGNRCSIQQGEENNCWLEQSPEKSTVSTVPLFLGHPIYPQSTTLNNHVTGLSSPIPYLSNKPIYKYCPLLAKAVDPEDGLDVVAGVPVGVEDDDSVGCDQVDS